MIYFCWINLSSACKMIIYNYLRRKKNLCFRPSTPIFDLLEHKYQDKWLQQRRQQELANRKEETQVKFWLKRNLLIYRYLFKIWIWGFFLHFNFEKFEFTSEVLNFLYFIISTVYAVYFCIFQPVYARNEKFSFFQLKLHIIFHIKHYFIKTKVFWKI